MQLPPIKADDLADLPPAGQAITRYMDKTPLNHRAVLAAGEWKNAVEIRNANG